MSEMTPQHPATEDYVRATAEALGLNPDAAVAHLDQTLAALRKADPMTPQPPAAPEGETDANGLTEAEVASIVDALSNEVLKESNHGYYRIDHAILDVALTRALPFLLERIVAERLRVVEGERDAAREALRVGAELDNHHNADACPYCTGATTARAESAEAAHERLRARVEALRDEWRDRGRIIASPGRPHRTAVEVAVEALDEILAGGEA